MSLRTILESIGIFICAVLLWFTLHQNKPEPMQKAETSPEVANLPKEKITPASVDVFPSDAKKKLGLTQAQQNDSSLYVLDSSKLPNDTHSQTVTTLLDKDTGAVTTEVRENPLPWLAKENNQEIRLDYVIKRQMMAGWSISYRTDLLQVKALHFGCGASIDFDHDARAYCGVGWKF